MLLKSLPAAKVRLAAGLALGDQALVMLGLSEDGAAEIVAALRSQLNPELRGHIGR